MTNTEKEVDGRGGKREGAGRHEAGEKKRKVRTLRFSDKEWGSLLALGGPSWIRYKMSPENLTELELADLNSFLKTLPADNTNE